MFYSNSNQNPKGIIGSESQPENDILDSDSDFPLHTA